MKYSGIDLHSNNCVVVVSDEADRVLVRRRVPNDAAAILALLAGHREELVGVVVESTYNWYWLVDALQTAGYRVHLANTAAIKRYEGLKHSGDEDDAAYLAQLLRLEILPSGYICPPAARAGFGAQAHAAGEEPHGPSPVGGEHAVARDRGRDAQLRGSAIDGTRRRVLRIPPGRGAGDVRQCGGDQDA